MYTFEPLPQAFRVLAWGRGIPSTTLAVMSARGEIEHLDAVLHCDPGWEHAGTYDIGDHYSTWLGRHGLHVEVLPTGDIQRQGAEEHIHIPFWVPTGGQLRRQCTRNFKIRPQRRRIREMLGYPPSHAPHPKPRSVEQWIGFTVEEFSRMKGSGVQYIVNRWPLVEKRMTRQNCIDYLTELGLPLPPPSSCVGCPYKDPGRWLATTTDEMDQAVTFDETNRHNPLAAITQGNCKADALFVYRHLRPLANTDFAADARRDPDPRQLSLFACEMGFCGV